MAGGSGLDRRRSPRYPARHRVEGASLDPRIGFRGSLCDLSVGGCNLRLDTHVPPGRLIEAPCNISGVIDLQVRGEVVWIKAATGGVLHGLVLTGFASEEDALFHRLYVERLARHAPAPSGNG